MGRIIDSDGNTWNRDDDLADMETDALVTTARVVAMLIGSGADRGQVVTNIVDLFTELTYRLETPTIDVAHLERQREFSRKAFGPGRRTTGVLDHIAKECDEVREHPTDLLEWVDLIILAFDGAWRAGHEPVAIIEAIKAKQTRNEERTWPDWRTLSEDMAIEHDRALDAAEDADEAWGRSD